MKVALIGAGNWGTHLARNLNELGALAAVAEVSAELRQLLAAQYPDLALYPDYGPVLESNVPAVAIATPVRSHFQIAWEALEAGKDLFVEKPLTLSVAEAKSLVNLARERGRILMVGHLLLYQPAVQWIKAFLDSGALGRVHSLHQERLNLGKARSVENALWSLGVHDVAVLLHLTGEVPDTVGITGQQVLQAAVEDDIYLHLGFAGGSQAHLHASWLWPEKRRRLVVIGDGGMLVYNEVEQTVTLHRKRIGSDLVNVDQGSEVVYRGSDDPLRLELQHFLQALETRQTPLSDGASAIEVIRVLERATQQLKGVHP